MALQQAIKVSSAVRRSEQGAQPYLSLKPRLSGSPTASYALRSMWLRSVAIEPKWSLPCGNCASIDPSE
jgi:hypothetical protein